MVARSIPAPIRFSNSRRIEPDGCWTWLLSTRRNGYGHFSPEHSTHVSSHRYAYELYIGPIPEGMQLDHLCRNRICCNPSHLEPVTCKENLLRGDTFNAKNASRTHCPKGHPYRGENLMLQNGSRHCRACRRQTTQAWRARGCRPK